MYKPVQIREKVELTAAELILLLEDVILDVLDRAEAGEAINISAVAKKLAVSYVREYRARKKREHDLMLRNLPTV